MAAPALVAVATLDQWESSRFDKVVANAKHSVVELAWRVDSVTPLGGASDTAPARPAGLAVDRACFVYHAIPQEGRIERVRWRATGVTESSDVLVPPAPPSLGAFVPTGPAPGAVQCRAAAVDDEGRLFVVDDADGSVAVYDLADRSLIQRSRFPGRALDVVSVGTSTIVLCADDSRPLWRLAARRDPAEVAGAAFGSIRLAAGSAGSLWGLDAAGAIWALDGSGRQLASVPGATDLEVAGDGSVVVADADGTMFRCFSSSDVEHPELHPLVGRNYDGRGIVRMPDGSIGFWTRAGRVRRAVSALLRYEPKGSVTIGPFDALRYRESWGRILVNACVPQGTSVSVTAAATDELSEEPSLGPPNPMHCRRTGPELPWARLSDDDQYETLEAPVGTSRGRYLWVRIELRGTTRSSPKVRAARMEHPGHDLLEQLPATYSRDAAMASFLQRYLGIASGVLDDIERRADERQILLDPWATPTTMLPWLASLIGLTLDTRWSERARRTLVREAACLFKKRGTKGALERMIEIFLDRAPPAPSRDGACARQSDDPIPRQGPRIIELYQVRGQGGGMLGPTVASSTSWSSSIVGGGLRVGGAAGVATAAPLAGTAQDAFSRSAHRFSVVVPAMLDDGQEQALRDLLDDQKPAHTAYELCTVGAGMRVGRGLYVELTSIVGPGSGFEQLRLGDSALGRDGILGRPHGGIRPEASLVGRTTRLES